MNLGNGSLIPQANGVINNEHPWIPVTPEKPVIQATKPVPVDKQGSLTKGTNWQEQLGNQSQFSLKKPVMQTTYPIAGEMQSDQIEGNNWIELLGLYSGVLQETPKNEALKNFSGAGLLGHGEHNLQDGAAGQANGCFNQNAGSYTQNIAKDVPIGDNTSWTEILGIKNAPAVLPIDGTPSTSTHGMAKPSFTISYPPIENQRTRYQSVGSVLLQQESVLHPNQGFLSSSLPKMPSDGFPVPCRPVYNLNSPPRAETAEVLCTASCFQFAPVTPDQGKQLKNHQQSDITNFSVDECLQQGKDKLEIISTNSQLGNHCDELLHSVIASPMASDLTTLKEKNISEDGGHGGIDLNKTPLQKPPKRKKHRPKVVVEGKPKRTPKPTTSKANISSENPSGKRKYVRRKGLEASTSAKQNERNGVEASGVSSAAKSCRRVLNFDVEDKRHNRSENWTGDNQAEAHLKRKPFDLNLHCQDTTCSTGFNTQSDISSTKERQQDGHNAEKQHSKRKNNLVHSNNQKPAEKSLLLAPTAPPPTARDHTLNVIARSLNLQNAACQKNDQSGYSQGNQHILGDDIGQTILQANTASAKFDAARKLMAQTLCTSVKETAEIYEKRGSKRDYCHISELTNPQSVDLMHSQFLSQEISNTSEQKKDSSQNGLGALEAHKRKKIENKCHGVASSISSSVASVQDCLRKVESRSCNYIHASSASSCLFGRLPVSNLEMQNTIGKQSNQIASDRCDTNTAAGNGFHEKKSSSRAYLRLWQVEPKFEENRETNSLNVIAGTTDCLLPSTPGVSAFAPGNESRTSLVDFSVQRQNLLTAASIQACRKEKVHPEENKKEKRSQHSSRKAKGQKEQQKCQVTVEEITYQLQGLEIGDGGKEVAAKEQNAIVPYKGDGAIVTYDGFDPMKRRRPRPKVDLDPETNRLWNLLMGNTRSESTETMDTDKEKWWEEERKVVRGRVDSFIARMHLVQGDRRFSQWKGSVVDSVIGVFLTQNVSDHLSSSAFMSLAAKFPLPLTTLNTNYCQNGAITWIEEPESQIIDPDGTVTYPEIMFRQPLYKQNSVTLSESTERRSDNLISETLSHLVNDSTSGTEEEVISSQNSSDSFPQATEDVRSSSESEVEDRIIMSNSNNCSSDTVPKTERTAMFKLYQRYAMTSPFLDKSSIPKYVQQENPQCIRQNSISIDERNAHAYPVISDVACLQGSLSPRELWLNKTSDVGGHAPCCYGSLGHKSMSSFLHRSVEITKNSGAGHSPKEIGGVQGSTNILTTQESGMPTNHTITTGQPVYQKQHPEDNIQLGSHFGLNQQSISSNRLERSKSFDPEGRSVIEPKRPDEAHAKLQSGHLCSSGEQFSNRDTNIPKARKKKNEVDKTKAFDWDSLRKKVLAKGGKKERSKDNMDSLDYEALRHADVNKISETIKERGMNNMLAERIKDFLNRLVTEHGSIDLEWLRDVPADQAKDYLLSIRGLGLKSVECVRLLTLHQIAFPVDTNVGRIAVRLGWVPLQPLPESLQLHLLELYPVLESIQKYLWPRLCKLDQRTLYELHYQMITFGKVFCTKSKPNCNACPLRAECRHFASAFASSRLALPGPEERSIVSSITSVANGSAPVLVKPMPLPPAETSEGWESQYIRANCEPIIEEPTTPEPSKEASETDIEDMFHDDPDEIPTIKLSFEELKMNVESFMQEQNVEIQPNDLSRALVALDPSVASIPAPKLKSVSRLRTEHLVYELPDSHPLLKGMDRRERDDPCPYLLALWNPGETASTSQSIEGRCSLQASDRLCSSIKEETNSQTVRGTLLIPCRTAMRGSFPLNGTYFQVNEMFADHESSENPIDVPRDWLWQLPRRTVYFGTSVTSIFRGLSTDEIMYCFWKGFVCVRGFEKKSRAPRPLNPRLHEAASKMTKNKNKVK